MKTHIAVATPVSTTTTDSPAVAWPTFDHEIGVTEAREMIVRFKRNHPGEKTAAAFTRVPLDQILAQRGCAGIRMYFAQHEDGSPTLVLVGVDSDGNDLDEGFIAQKSFLCPPFCDLNSVLDT